MCGKLWGKIMTFVLALLIIMPACAMTGCSGSKEPDNKTSVDYTVVENADLPEELRKLIESKKDKVMRLTYTTIHMLWPGMERGRPAGIPLRLMMCTRGIMRCTLTLT